MQKWIYDPMWGLAPVKVEVIAETKCTITFTTDNSDVKRTKRTENLIVASSFQFVKDAYIAIQQQKLEVMQNDLVKQAKCVAFAESLTEDQCS